MKFQGRGNVVLRVLDSDGIPGAGQLLCPDSFAVDFGVDSFEHRSKCGLQDVVDYRGITGINGTLTLSFSDVEDVNFAFATLGTMTAEGAPGTVTDEQMPSGLVNGDWTYLGNGTRHFAITSLVIEDSDSPPNTANLTTDYTLDAASGKVTWVDVSGFTQPFKASYGYTDPAKVSMMTAATREYNVTLEFLNRANANDPGTLELFRVRFDPAANLDFLSDELQIPQMTGSILADTTRDPEDTEHGQFGVRRL